jgi:hypothetical protein
MKHVGKIVSYGHIQKLIPPGFSLHLKGDQVGLALGAIARYYCDRANLIRLCPQECGLCNNNLRRILDVSRAKSPMGALVWSAKNMAASLRDIAADMKKPAENLVPMSELEQTNPFLDILQGL